MPPSHAGTRPTTRMAEMCAPWKAPLRRHAIRDLTTATSNGESLGPPSTLWVPGPVTTRSGSASTGIKGGGHS
ncbi:unspecified product [Leishmania tarentolae]|uniref:Unspecified product n=1 Tax=Leishmania tarentolae TaxID=5689 RepID=A0A640KDN3_LEITA|nr:unspecified product [Leishmania tarentolae]